MNRFVFILLLLLLFGCGSKKSNRTEHREEQKSERKEVKDSSTRVEKAQKVSTFDLQQSQSYEITLESDKDEMGNSKDLYFTRMRDGPNEALVIRGGKATIHINQNNNQALTQEYTIIQESTTTSQQQATIVQEHRQTTKSQKQVSAQPWWLIASTLLLGLLIFIFIRFKR
nr:MAG TPA: TRAF PROTEIN, TRAO PROTEIN, TRAN ADHESION, BACTERIAL SECRETION.5A [Caudoviricetes sp.]